MSHVLTESPTEDCDQSIKETLLNARVPNMWPIVLQMVFTLLAGTCALSSSSDLRASLHLKVYVAATAAQLSIVDGVSLGSY